MFGLQEYNQPHRLQYSWEFLTQHCNSGIVTVEAGTVIQLVILKEGHGMYPTRTRTGWGRGEGREEYARDYRDNSCTTYPCPLLCLLMCSLKGIRWRNWQQVQSFCQSTGMPASSFFPNPTKILQLKVLDSLWVWIRTLTINNVFTCKHSLV